MQRQPIHLCPDRRDHFRMAMAQGKNAEPAETIYEFAAADVADQASFSAPFNNGVNRFCFRPTIEILIEIVDRLSDELVLLLRCQVIYRVKIHAGIVTLLDKLSHRFYSPRRSELHSLRLVRFTNAATEGLP